jgi:hypothetical protein
VVQSDLADEDGSKEVTALKVMGAYGMRLTVKRALSQRKRVIFLRRLRDKTLEPSSRGLFSLQAGVQSRLFKTASHCFVT